MSMTSGLRVEQCQRLADHRGELAVGDQHAGAAVAQHEGDGLGVEPGVQRVQHRAAHRHAERRLVHRRRVRRHDRDGVVLADAAPRQRGGQAAAAGIGLAPGVALGAVHHRGLVRIDIGRALEKRQRRQRRIVRLVPVEARSDRRCCRSLRVSTVRVRKLAVALYDAEGPANIAATCAVSGERKQGQGSALDPPEGSALLDPAKGGALGTLHLERLDVRGSATRALRCRPNGLTA